jgi:hypothetical protein
MATKKKIQAQETEEKAIIKNEEVLAGVIAEVDRLSVLVGKMAEQLGIE